MILRLSLLFTGLWLLVTAGAQELAQGKITGVVVDAAVKKPLANTTVTAIRKGDSTVAVHAVTTAKGAFELMIKDTGLYRLSFTHTGYKEQVVQLSVAAGFAGWHLGSVSLTEGSGMLAEVVMKANRPMVEQRADRLVYNAENDLSTMGGTAADVLRNVPMLSVDGDGNVQLRGSSNIRVLINNRPSSIVAVSVADALRQIPAEMIKAVEVITSPPARYDAEGTAGIINIITKRNTLQGITGSLNIVPGNVSTIGFSNVTFRRKRFGINAGLGINQFYNRGTTYLERYTFADETLFIQEGKTKNRSGFINPSLGFDVSLNEKNSIGGGVRLNWDHNSVKNQQVVTSSVPGIGSHKASIDVLSRTKGVGYDANMDYLKTFKNPQQEFSLLTLYTKYNSDNTADQDRFNEQQKAVYLQRNLNKSENIEATLQADYTQPFKNKATLEIGAKTVLRKAGSNVDYRNVYPQINNSDYAENDFSYSQNVWAAYASYGFKAFKKLNIKMGSRYEKTGVEAHFKTTGNAFSTGYDNFVPSFNAAITLKEKHTFRAGYTQRLQRPQLFFLNPYREVITPQVIRVGNPGLNAEVASLYELGYSTYAKDFSINAGLYGRVTNNAIATNYTLAADTTIITFLNIAQNKTYGFTLSTNVKPVKAWSLNSNFNLYYAKLDGGQLANEGLMYSFFVSSIIDLGKGWTHGFTGSFNSRRVILQGRMAAFYYHNTQLRKDILKKKGAVGINLANPFMRGTRVRNHIKTAAFEQRENDINYTRGIRLSLTYRFGQLQQQKAPRKPKKTINNDDALRGQ